MPAEIEAMLMERTRLMQLAIAELKTSHHELETDVANMKKSQNDKCATRLVECSKVHTSLIVQNTKTYVTIAIIQTIVVAIAVALVVKILS